MTSDYKTDTDYRGSCHDTITSLTPIIGVRATIPTSSVRVSGLVGYMSARHMSHDLDVIAMVYLLF
jgi:hypothetical protein